MGKEVAYIVDPLTGRILRSYTRSKRGRNGRSALRIDDGECSLSGLRQTGASFARDHNDSRLRLLHHEAAEQGPL